MLLYSMHMSLLLHYTRLEVASTILGIWLPFAGTVLLYSAIREFMTGRHGRQTQSNLDYPMLRRRLRIWFRIWVFVTVVEIIVSGGVPLFWALTNSSKAYVDFGIKSLHGFVNSLQTSIAICYFVLFLITKSRRYLKVPIFFLLWAAIIINRNMMLVTLLEFAVLYLRFHRLRVAAGMKLAAGVLSFIFLFGVIGDIRQGDSATIRGFAQPTEDYPQWLPTGVLWGYIYITTPINNLIYNIKEYPPAYNSLFPNTASTLFPSVIRTIVYGDKLGDAESGQLVVSYFNVSTAYIGPYQDFGYIGMALFSIAIASSCLFFWYRDDLKGILMLAVMIQCLVLTLFFDHFFYLPVITQLGWIWYFFLPRLRFWPANSMLPRKLAGNTG
jgi:oligosaccharide repeat unit polymerase